jgi:exopolysaccharide production protein ExoQ
MGSSLATLVYALGILGLFFLNRDKSVRTSRALWIPVIWFWILGSRAVSIWLGGRVATDVAAATQMDGSPTDALVFLLLIVGGLAVLVVRGQRCSRLLMMNLPIIWYFAYCLMSVIWSDFPDVSLKRWFKATGDVVMALVVVTDAQPLDALRRIFSRVGFVLVPASTLVIKYYPDIGSNYDVWTGARFNSGVTTDKNILGVTTYVLALGTLWQLLRLWKQSDLPNRSRQLVAQFTLLGFAVWNLFTANSATSESCLILGAILMLATGLRRFRSHSTAVHKLVLTVIVLGVLIKITGTDAVVIQALGRNTNLTGRASDIWPALFRLAPNGLVGVGFESFWLGPRLHKVWEVLPPGEHIDEAHNGYLELYLQLGVIGVVLMISILINGYRRSVAAFRADPGAGSLMLAYVLTATLYSYAEAGFRMLDYAWSFLILAIIAANHLSRTYPQKTPIREGGISDARLCLEFPGIGHYGGQPSFQSLPAKDFPKGWTV